MAVIGDAYILLHPDGSKFSSDAEKEVTSSLGDIAKKGATLLSGIFAAGVLKDAAKQGFAELKEESEATALTTQAVNAQIEQLGDKATITVDHIDELSTALLQQSGVDDELAQKGAQLLLSFSSIQNQVGKGNDIFDRALTAANDLSVRGYGDLTATSKLLGVALEQPEQGFTKLRRAGVLFTEEQKNTIRGLEESGNHLGAQAALLDIVEAKVGGAGKAYGDSLPGQLTKAQESLKNTEAALIAGAAPAFSILADAALSASEAVQHLPAPLRDTIAIVGAGATGLFLIARPLSGLIDIYKSLTATRTASAAAGATEAASNEAVTGSLVGMTAASEGAALATTDVAVAEGAVATNSAATVAGLYAVETGLSGVALAASVIAAPVAIVAGLSKISDALGLTDTGLGHIEESVSKAKGALAELPEGFKGKDLVGSIDQAIDSTDAYATALGHAGVTSEQLAMVVLAGGDAFDQFEASVRNNKNVTDEDKQAFYGLTQALQDNAEKAINAAVAHGDISQAQADAAIASHSAADGTNNYVAALESLPPAASGATGAAFDVRDAIAGDADALDEATTKLKGYTDALHASIDPLFGVVDASRSLKEAQSAASEAQAVVLFNQAAYNNAVRDFGPNSQQAHDALVKLGDSQDDLAKKSEEAVKQAQALDEAAFNLAAQVRLHPETFQKATEQIKAWADQGLITTEQAKRMNEQLQGALTLSQQLDGSQVDMTLMIDTAESKQRLAELQLIVADLQNKIGGANGLANSLAQNALAGGLGNNAGGFAFAGGGEASPFTSFSAGEAGVELALLGPGRYRAGAGGASIVPHTQTMDFLNRLNTALTTSARYGEGGTPTSTMHDESISLTIERLLTPDPAMSAVVLGRSLRGLRHKAGRGTGRTT